MSVDSSKLPNSAISEVADLAQSVLDNYFDGHPSPVFDAGRKNVALEIQQILRRHSTEQPKDATCPPEGHGGTGPGLTCTTCGMTDAESYEHTKPGESVEYAERMGHHAFRATEQALRPIPMRLRCPDCFAEHIDKDDWATRPHKTHLCETCGGEFRPANVPTVGVASLDA